MWVFPANPGVQTNLLLQASWCTTKHNKVTQHNILFVPRNQLGKPKTFSLLQYFLKPIFGIVHLWGYTCGFFPANLGEGTNKLLPLQLHDQIKKVTNVFYMFTNNQCKLPQRFNCKSLFLSLDAGKTIPEQLYLKLVSQLYRPDEWMDGWMDE